MYVAVRKTILAGWRYNKATMLGSEATTFGRRNNVSQERLQIGDVLKTLYLMKQD